MEFYLDKFLLKFKCGKNNIYEFSPTKNYEISKDHYNKFLNFNRSINYEAIKNSGLRLRSLLENRTVPNGLALEIGCGAGAGSRPLVASEYFLDYLITDASSDLAEITRNSINSLGYNNIKVRYGTLLGEDINIFENESISAIFMFATLHHFLDWQKILLLCIRILKPGGIVFFTDPCVESNLILSTLFISFESQYRRNNPTINNFYFSPMHKLINATKFRGNPYIENKNTQEDKHFFRIKDLYRFSQKEKVKFLYYPNQNLANLSIEGNPPKIEFFAFLEKLLSYSQHFPDDLIKAFFDEMRPQLEFLEYFWAIEQGPMFNFTGIIQKPE